MTSNLLCYIQPGEQFQCCGSCFISCTKCGWSLGWIFVLKFTFRIKPIKISEMKVSTDTLSKKFNTFTTSMWEMKLGKCDDLSPQILCASCHDFFRSLCFRSSLCSNCFKMGSCIIKLYSLSISCFFTFVIQVKKYPSFAVGWKYTIFFCFSHNNSRTQGGFRQHWFPSKSNSAANNLPSKSISTWFSSNRKRRLVKFKLQTTLIKSGFLVLIHICSPRSLEWNGKVWRSIKNFKMSRHVLR